MLRARVILSVCCLALLPATALADPETDVALAQSLFEEATQLLRGGHYAEACPKLAESQRLDPGGGTLLNLGVCYEKAEKYTSAYLTYSELLGVSIKEGNREREQIARERIAAVQPKRSMVTVVVPDSVGQVEGIDIRFDGAAMHKVAWGSPTSVDMGEHVVTATAPGRIDTRVVVRVDRAGGEFPVQVPELLPIVIPKPAVVMHRETIVKYPQRVAAFSLLGAGSVAAIVGVVGTIVAVDQHSRANAECGPSGCNPRYLEHERSAGDAAWVANVAFPIAAVCIATSVLLWITSSETRMVPTSSSSVAIRIP